MSCSVCPMKLTREVYAFEKQACGSCRKQIRQMQAGFHGVTPEPQKVKETWNNTEAFLDWQSNVTIEDLTPVHIRKKDAYTVMACDVRDMKQIVGLPTWLPLEAQVYEAWVMEGRKDEIIQEVLGLTYSQLLAVKNVVKKRLQKHMNYYRHIKNLAEE